MKGMGDEDKAQEKGKDGYEGTGDTWCMIVKLIQNTWNTGEIPCQMLLTSVVLTSKGNTSCIEGLGYWKYFGQ